MIPQRTVTSEELIEYLEKKGHKLGEEEKDEIRRVILETMRTSYDFGCDETREEKRILYNEEDL